MPVVKIFNTALFVKTGWLVILSTMLWFNLATAPLIMLWPEITETSEGKGFFYALWFNETIFLLDIIRQFFDPPKGSQLKDVYEVFVSYVKSNLILDVVSTLPQVMSGLDNFFVMLKIIRIYRVSMLHYPLELIVTIVLS